MLINNAVITGSLTVNGTDVTYITGSSQISSSFLALSSSYLITSASYVVTSGSYAITSASFAQTSGSLSVRTGNLEATSSTLTNASSSFAAQSASLSTRLTTDETNITTLTSASSSFAAQSASLSTRLTTDETNITTLTNASASFAAQSASLSTRLTTDETNFSTTSGSLSTRVTNLEATSSTVSSSFASTSGSIAGRVTTIESKYATTGSNTFTNIQYISSSTNAAGFTTSASLYTDGGARITKDLFVSGTTYLTNLTVYGTASVQYITSSQINVGANIIYLNTQTPAARYGGMAVADSGSNPGVTGSMLWDSVNNGWIYTRESGSTYSGGALISGPRSSVQGSEQSTIANYIMKGQGGDHITGSQIYDDGTTVQIPGNLQVTGSLSGSSAVFSSTVNATNGLLIGNGGATATTNYLPKFTGTSTIGNSIISATTAIVTIESAAANYAQLQLNGAAGYGSQLKLGEATGGYGAAIMYNVNVGTGIEFYSGGVGSGGLVGYWSSTGLGIGSTSNGGYRLQVTGTTNLTGALTGTSAVFSSSVTATIFDSTSNAFRFNGSNALSLVTLNSQNVVKINAAGYWGTQLVGANDKGILIDNTGNVGIGTTSPSSPLEISSATGTQFKMSTNDATSANNAGIFFYNEASSNSATRRSYVLLDPNGANASGGDYAYFDMYGSGTVRVMNQLTAGTLALGVGGTNILNITGSNVGIGTTSPGAKLEVVGVDENVLKLKNKSGQPALVRFNDTSTTADPYVGSYGNNLAFGIYGVGESMRIDSSRNVSIGTASTQAGTRLLVAGGYFDVWSSANTLLRLNHDGTRGIIETFTGGAYSNTAINPNGGNVGIGTSSLIAKLQVERTGAAQADGNGAIMARATDGDANWVSIGNVSTAGTSYGWIQSSSATAGYRNLILNPSGGNVGIGTTTPATLLQVSGSSTDNLVFVNNTNANGYGSVRCANNTNKAAVFGVGGGSVGAPYADTGYIYTDPSIDLVLSIGSGEKMRIKSTGKVQVPYTSYTEFFASTAYSSQTGVISFGNSYDQASLGDGLIRTYASTLNASPRLYLASGTGGVYLTLNSTSWTANSDERLKNINGIIENAVDKISTLRAVKYSWKEDDTNKTHLGLIAQDVQKVIPEVVDVNENDEIGTLGVRYTDLIPVLVKAIQEQQLQIEALKTEINELKNK